jgi:putative transposase
MILSFKYRVLPTKKQHQALAAILESQRQLYNAALEERIDCYRKTGRNLTYNDQSKGLTEWRRQDAEGAHTPRRIQLWTLERVDRAFAGFFRRIKARNGKVGFPRFRSAGRWSSFGFAHFHEHVRWDGKRLRWRGFPGGLRVHLHQSLPEDADIRCCSFTRDVKGWSVSLQVRVEVTERREPIKGVGIDLGIKTFAHLSDGTEIPHPHFARRAERKLRIAQRTLARAKRGSRRRKKATDRLARSYRKIANTRQTWLHQRSAEIVKRYDLIAVEAVKIQDMPKYPNLNRSIMDAGWGYFLQMLAYKAEKAGCQFHKVDPKNTSQRCSGCGEMVQKKIAVRTHKCSACGIELHRDHNAALNILQAVAGLGAGNVAQWSERRPKNISPS